MNKSSLSQSSASIASSSIQELYRRRALVTAFGSMVPFGGNVDSRSTEYVSSWIEIY